MPDQQTVKITEAKGRPMLEWVEKRSLDYVTAFPAQPVEREDPLDGEHGLKAMALRRWVDLNPELLKYEIIFTASDAVAFNQLSAVRAFVGPGSESL